MPLATQLLVVLLHAVIIVSTATGEQLTLHFKFVPAAVRGDERCALQNVRWEQRAAQRPQRRFNAGAALDTLYLRRADDDNDIGRRLHPRFDDDFYYDRLGNPYLPSRPRADALAMPLSAELSAVPRSFGMMFVVDDALLIAAARSGSLRLACMVYDVAIPPIADEQQQRRHFAAEGVVDTDLKLTHLPPLHATGPISTQYNVVLMPSGYTNDMTAGFIQNATMLFRSLFAPAYPSLLETAPWFHYVVHMNWFSLFVESLDVGATDLGQSVTRDTAMKCSIISQLPRLDGRLRCDRDVVAAFTESSAASLQSFPATTLAIVIVNTPLRVAGAVRTPFRQLYITNSLIADALTDGKRGARTLFNALAHLLGHALGSLADEVDSDGFQSSEVALPNCAHPSAPLPWAHWIVEQRENPSRFNLSDGTPTLLDEQPRGPCQFTNYLRPSSTCLMGEPFFADPSAPHHFCPVCMSHATESFIDLLEGTRAALPRTEAAHETVPFLFWPLCPLPGEIVITTIDEFITVSVNKYLVPDRGFSVTWSVAGTTIAENVTSVILEIISIVELGKSSNFELVATVVDTQLRSLLAARPLSRRRSNYSTSFNFQVVANPNTIEGWTVRKCRDPLFFDQGTEFRVLCVSSRGCGVNYTTQAVAESISQLGALRRNVGLVVLVLLVLIIVTVPWIVFARQHHRNEVVHSRDVNLLHLRIRLRASHRVYRNFVLISSLVVLLGAFAAVITAVKLYVVTLTLTLYPLLVILACSLLFQLLGYLAFTGGLSRNHVHIFVSGGIFTFLSVLLIAFVAAFSRLDEYLSDPSGENAAEMRRLWVGSVRDNPSTACEFQNQFECSGWDRSCVLANVTEYCPVNCDANKRFDLPCAVVAVAEIRKKLAFVYNVVRIAIPWFLFNNVMHLLCARSFLQVRRLARKRIALGASSRVASQSGDTVALSPARAPAVLAVPLVEDAPEPAEAPSRKASDRVGDQDATPPTYSNLDFMRFLQLQDNRIAAVAEAEAFASSLCPQNNQLAVSRFDLQGTVPVHSGSSPPRRVALQPVFAL